MNPSDTPSASEQSLDRLKRRELMFGLIQGLQNRESIRSLEDIQNVNRVLNELLSFGVDLNVNRDVQRNFLALCLELQKNFLLPPLGFDMQKDILNLLKALDWKDAVEEALRAQVSADVKSAVS